MRMPNNESIDLALMWLEVYEDDDKELVRDVINWLEHERYDRMIRNGARAAGVSVPRFRRELEARMSKS